MEVFIIENPEEKPCVIIKCNHTDNEIMRLKTHIELYDNTLKAKHGNNICFVRVAEVLYFEAVDNRTFLYTEKEVMEIKQRLYELELILSDKDYIRISKSLIVNVNKIVRLMPELNRTITVEMCNCEKLVISRRYVAAFKKLLCL